MAEQHDLVDDLIDISKGLGVLRNPLSGLTDTLLGTGGVNRPVWNPADYKEKPRGNTLQCMLCRYEQSACSACMDVCPVDAITIEDDAISVSDDCRECGLCVSVCPTESFVSPKIQPKKLYELIAAAAQAHETAYVTCTRSLKRVPRENEVVLACVGDVSPELWFAILAEYDNVSVFLPVDICARCKTTTGEEQLSEFIAQGEEWAGVGLGLEVDARALRCVKRREYERKEFMDNIVRTTGLAVSKFNPATAALMSVTQKLREHSNRLSDLEKTLSTAAGISSEKRRRILQQGRQLMLSALQLHPELAQSVRVWLPECDYSRCAMCAECVRQCPVHACDLVASGRFKVEPEYCVGCGLCAEVCPNRALSMHECNCEQLVVSDPAIEKKKQAEQLVATRAAAAGAAARKKLDSLLDQVEKLGE
ncbi:4Fe-4S binding protein [Collinsella sp. zg1085]|uniref:4Fe-4S binding protein n=1 Tax=Collinsella sp. zg1085 TaxID=2844380 RepID=UPI001C0DE392|nr:4Fe-4S binding protein [Collinsella sp. zg1085]QWT17934.1 4Fe-4S binding protein [Collinsella sp. zg1085]